MQLPGEGMSEEEGRPQGNTIRIKCRSGKRGQRG
jgi:hypothetical protein